jgi:hypothetical protein
MQHQSSFDDITKMNMDVWNEYLSTIKNIDQLIKYYKNMLDEYDKNNNHKIKKSNKKLKI